MGAVWRSNSVPSNVEKVNYMKRFLLLGLAALGVVVLTPIGSKADEGFSVHIGSAYPQYGPYYDRYDYPRYRYYYDRNPDEYRWHRWHQRHHRYYYDPDSGRYYYRD